MEGGAQMMGHGFPKELWDEMADLIIEHIKNANELKS
jgi:hypothetical protein